MKRRETQQKQQEILANIARDRAAHRAEQEAKKREQEERKKVDAALASPAFGSAGAATTAHGQSALTPQRNNLPTADEILQEAKRAAAIIKQSAVPPPLQQPPPPLQQPLPLQHSPSPPPLQQPPPPPLQQPLPLQHSPSPPPLQQPPPPQHLSSVRTISRTLGAHHARSQPCRFWQPSAADGCCTKSSAAGSLMTRRQSPG
jgi:hypothetical protein